MRRNTNAYPAFPEIKEDLGYNPARFLVPTDVAMDELSWTTRTKAFIRGMDDVETIRAWQTVEVALEQGQNGGPRQQVIKWLNQRKAEIDGTAQTAPPATSPEAVTEDTSSLPTEPPDDGDVRSPAGGLTNTATATTITADGGATPEETAICPHCHSELTHEAIAGQDGYWCLQCQDFQEPRTPMEVDA